MKPHKGHPTVSFTPSLPSNFLDNHRILRPQSFVDTRTIQKDDTTKTEVLVQWEGLLLEEASWEDIYDLDDKVSLEGERIDVITSTTTAK